MFDLMVYIIISAFYVSLIIWTVIFISRIVLAVISNLSVKEKVSVALLPCNYGVYLYIKNKKILKVLNILVILLFIFAFFASLFLFYNALGL